MRDRLPSRRLRRRVEVQFGEPGGQRFTGYSGNISASGIMIRSVRVVGAGAVIEMELKFPDGPVHVKGRVRWARQGNVQLLASGRIGMGVVFISPPAALLERLASSFVESSPG